MALAPQLSNPGTRGQNARYDISGLRRGADGRWTDGTWHYDDNGLSWDRPDSVVAGLNGADNNGAGGVLPAAAGGGSGLYNAAVNSPWYQQAAAATNAAEAADAASRKSNIQQLLIQFGLVPEGFADKYGDVDQTTRDLAGANTASGISTYARLQQAFLDAQRDSSRRLAAKGLRRSGARGYNMRRNQLGYDQGKADAIAKLLGTTGSIYSQYGQGAYQRQMGLLNALQSAIGSMSGSWSPTPMSVSAPSAASQQTYSSSTPTIGGSNNYYGPSGGGGGSGYTSPQHPLLMPEGY